MGLKTTDLEDRLPPSNAEAERAVIGTMIRDYAAVIDEVLKATIGNGEFFYDIRHRELFFAILSLNSQGKHVDSVGVKEAIRERLHPREGMDGYVDNVIDEFHSAAGISYWLDILRDYYLARGLIRLCTLTAAGVTPGTAREMLDGLMAKLSELAQLQSGIQSFTGPALAHSLMDFLQQRYDRRQSGKATGIVSGLKELDKFNDGFQFSEQSIIAARPSIGKTAVACGIACQACLTDRVPTLIITLEMTKAAILGRMLSIQCGVPMHEIRWGKFTERDFAKFGSFTTIIKNAPIHFVESSTRGLSSLEVATEIRRHVKLHGVKLVLIDYLQKIKANQKHEKRTYEVGEVSGMLRSVAQETGVALVTLAQLNREPDKDKGRQPRLCDLADSGQIERDADLVILLDRKRDEPAGKATLAVAKQRDGETGVANVWFNGQFCRFQNNEPLECPRPRASQPHNDP